MPTTKRRPEAFSKGLTIRMGQTHVQKYMRPLLQRIERGEIDPTVIITHTVSLDEAPEANEIFRDKRDDCVKVVLKPGHSPNRLQSSMSAQRRPRVAQRWETPRSKRLGGE